MTGFTNDTNKGRVAKMCDTLALLNKSAKSNRADAEEVKHLLGPVLAELHVLGVLGIDAARGKTPPPAPAPAASVPLSGSAAAVKPVWANVREMCETAPLTELTTALAVYMNRVDEALHERGD